MALTEDIEFVGRLIDNFALTADRMSVAATRPEDRGVPLEMQVGAIDDEGWVEWKVLPSTLTEADVVQLESRFRIQLPPLFQAYLLARSHLFDQVISARGQIIEMVCTPIKNPLKDITGLIESWKELIDAGYIPFATWGDGWGPMLFDTEYRSPDGDCPIVWMDHELLVPLGSNQWRDRKQVLHLAKSLHRSFRELLIDIFESKVTDVP